MAPTRFAWWDTHDRAWRRARLLFVLASSVGALYIAGLSVVVGASLRGAGVGPWSRINAWGENIGPLGIALVTLGVFGVAALAITLIGWRGLPRTTLRLTGGRAPTGDSATGVEETLATCSLAYGMPAPQLWIVDDPAPNGLAFGRPRHGGVCLTTGALQLPRDEIDALCMYHVTALASRTFAYATSAADLVLVGEWCTRILWFVCPVVILSTIVGVPFAVAAAFFLGIVVLVALTRPLLAVADRGLVKLIDETAELVDLETAEHSAQPAALAHLLLDLIENPAQAQSRWEIAHLWFERDVVEMVDGRGGMAQTVGAISPWEIGVPAFVERCRYRSRRGLIERASTVVNLADGDTQLRARLARARAAIPAR
jgi:hypothetical protein